MRVTLEAAKYRAKVCFSGNPFPPMFKVPEKFPEEHFFCEDDVKEWVKTTIAQYPRHIHGYITVEVFELKEVFVVRANLCDGDLVWNDEPN